MIIGLLALEQNAWMTERERRQFFELLDVPNHQIHDLMYQKQFVESRDGDITTVESFRPFITLPRWLKNRIKFRLRRPMHEFPQFSNFIERTLRNE